MRWPGVDRWLGTPHNHELAALSWEELRGLLDLGWEVGSHTCSHPYLPDLDDVALAQELRASKARIEAELGGECASLAYPYGGVDARVVGATRDAGYRWAATIPRVLPRPQPLLWPRAAIFHDDDLGRFRAKVSPALRGLRASRPGRALDRARVAVSERR
jgi:peptidoglycan/xylan/chitin deacetylase (PgdA/CDA1 family)